ncbi:uncharacterized protein LOC129249138 [Anastrepha obliqua]|uniref:uncharacterized protein LOC129249138 n=1 Tax=Anastrepha obliqua TaxID=95512 RepID=UPI00240988F0|nr:uncharacterized protein LOC129249138 [Anastrepha obliqua]
MTTYSFRGTAKTWTPRQEDEAQHMATADCKQLTNACGSPLPLNLDAVNDKWNNNQLFRLLRFYAAHTCLWDTSDPGNRNRKLRKAALMDITAAMGDGGTCAQVLQKINVLRATYRYEKRRIKQRIRKGIGAKTKLKWFALADSFLRKVPRSERNRKKEDADSNSDLEDVVVFTIDPDTLFTVETNDFSQYEEVYIKKETVENQKTVENESYPVNEMSPPTEIEVSSPIKSESVVAEQRKWTTHESLQFIFLLRSYPLLWHLSLNDTEKIEQQSFQQENALEDISRIMQLSKQRLRKRLQTFFATYRLEMEKISKDTNYTPNFVWWPMVQEYIENTRMEQVNANESAIDGKQAIHNKIKPVDHSALDAPAYKSTDALALSACSSPTACRVCSPPLPNNENSNGMSSCSFADHQIFSQPPMKLIWNGLEDDLLEGKWSLKHSVKFLRLYGSHRCLWDLNDPDYRSREMRTAAIEDIAAAMGYGLDADYVAKKIKIFRITYMQHRKRMLEATKQNHDPDIQLRWFPLADSFLRPHIGLRSIKEQEREMPQFDFQYVYANLNLIDPGLLADFD